MLEISWWSIKWGQTVVTAALVHDEKKMQNYSIIILTPVLIFYLYIYLLFIYCLLLHGIKEGRSGSVKAFLIFHYTIFGLAIACIFISSNVFAVGYQMFTIPCGLLLMNVLTFLFVFDIGFCVVLHSIYLENEKTEQKMKRNMEFIKASFGKF